MLNEKGDVRVILRNMTKTLDGMSCIAACILAIAMAFMNALIPKLVFSVGANQTEKWIAIWLFSPVFSFLIYVRSQQLFDGHGLLWSMVRSIVVLLPIFVLVYFNF